ncbi:MAG: hypothetical protein L3J54_14220 [Draconibacterium sp.]|nr:hypothetical protein [Draconibacterium sp.]
MKYIYKYLVFVIMLFLLTSCKPYKPDKFINRLKIRNNYNYMFLSNKNLTIKASEKTYSLKILYNKKPDYYLFNIKEINIKQNKLISELSLAGFFSVISKRTYLTLTVNPAYIFTVFKNNKTSDLINNFMIFQPVGVIYEVEKQDNDFLLYPLHFTNTNFNNKTVGITALKKSINKEIVRDRNKCIINNSEDIHEMLNKKLYSRGSEILVIKNPVRTGTQRSRENKFLSGVRGPGRIIAGSGTAIELKK